jgi:Homeodomain-like domain
MRTASLEDRVTIVALAGAGHTDADIAQRVGWTVRTVRKWRQRGQRQGRSGLASALGRPSRGAMSTFPEGVCSTVRALRQAHPGWGPLTMRNELERDASLAAEPLPSRATIARWLQTQGLARPYERHQDLPQPEAGSAQAAHDVWEIDARGHEPVPHVGVVTLINLNDRYSRVKLLSCACWLGQDRARRHPTTQDYQLAIRRAACDWGLPKRLEVDRDSVYYDNTSKSPFPTRLHLWLLALGVEVGIGPAHCPQKRGQTERSHQTWYHQVLEGQTFATYEALDQALRQRRDVMNEHLPCASLDGRSPLAACPEARRPQRLYRPEWEEQLLDLSRVHAYLAQGRWFRKASNVGAVSVGDYRYGLGPQWARYEVEITFDPTDKCLVFTAPGKKDAKRLPIKGPSKTELMGELGPLANFNHFQLALPFTWAEWRMTRLSETFASRFIET